MSRLVRLLLKVGFIVLGVLSYAHAQTTTTYTGVIKDLAQNPITAGQVTFTLSLSPDSTIPGTGRFVPTTVICNINTDGTLSGSGGGACSVTMNTALSPTGTSYKICLQPNYSTPGSCFFDYALTTSKDISTIAPTLQTGPLNYSGIPGPPGCVLGTTCTSNLTPKNVNGTVYANLYAGIDIGAKIMAAIADVGNCGQVIVSPGSYSFSTPIIKPRCVNLRGASSFSTVLTWTPTTGVAFTAEDALGDNTYTQGVISDLTLAGPGTGTATGVSIGDGSTSHWADRQNFNHVRITGFNVGMTWGNNAWSTTVSESVITNNNTGLTYPDGLVNSGEAIVFIGSSIQNSATYGMNLPGFADFYFYGSSCDFNGTQCGIVNVAHFYGMHFESTHGRMLTQVTDSGNNVSSVEVYGGEVVLNTGGFTTSDVFFISAIPNPMFRVVGTVVLVNPGATLTTLVNWAGTGSNAVLDIQSLPFMGGNVGGLTNSTCLFQGCHIDYGAIGQHALNGSGWSIQNNGNALLNTITSGNAGGGGASLGFKLGFGYISGNGTGLAIYPNGLSSTPLFITPGSVNLTGFGLGADSLASGGGTPITNTSHVPVTSATAPGGTCATPNGFVAVVVNSVTLHLATCP